MDNTTKKKTSQRSIWPYAIIAFFTIVITVNLWFIYTALKSDDGLVDKDYYAKGILYNKTLEDEATLGWQISLAFGKTSGEVLKGEASNDIAVKVLDKDNSSLKDATVRVVLMRPATDSYDKEFPLEFNGALHKGGLFIPLSGFWDIKVIVERGDSIVERIFRVKV